MINPPCGHYWLAGACLTDDLPPQPVTEPHECRQPAGHPPPCRCHWCGTTTPSERSTDMTQQEINRLAATTPAAHARREQPAARVGQVWKSTDRREDRWVRVVEIDAQFAVVEPCDPAGEPHHNPRRTRVRISPTGRLNRYRLVQDPPLPGLGEDTDRRRSERPTTPTPTHTTPEASSAAYGHAAAVKRPSPATPGRWQLPPEPDVPQLRDPAGCRWQRDPAGWTRVDEADDPAWRDWPWWRLLVRRGPLTAAPVARTSSPTMSDPTTVPCDCSCHRCCVPMDASCEDCEDNHDDH